MKVKNFSQRSLFSGFTIVELIIVITVIGILASIAIVSYSGSQNRAKKSSFEATAQQVKLKLGDHLTDKNNYPSTKGASVSTNDSVLKYLNDSGSPTLATDFNKTTSASAAIFSYTPSPSGCNNSTTMCTSYTITVTKDKWSGAASDSNITVSP